MSFLAAGAGFVVVSCFTPVEVAGVSWIAAVLIDCPFVIVLLAPTLVIDVEICFYHAQLSPCGCA